MKKTFIFLIFVLLLGFVSIQAQSESEPNNTFASATLISNTNEVTDVTANFSENADIDIYKINMSVDKIYHLYSFSDDTDLPDDILVELFYESDTTLNILTGDIRSIFNIL